MIQNYQFNFCDLQIDRKEISKLLGFEGNEMPEPFNSYLDEAFQEANELCNIQGAIFTSNKIQFHSNFSEFSVEGKLFEAGKLVTRQLKAATSLMLFICTAGEDIGQKSQSLLHGDDPAKGYIYDVLGSLTVEAAMDKIMEQRSAELLASGIKTSNRYSPGYCDWAVKDQHQLFSFFPENHCGISLNASSLMHPIKSVSGVIGIGKNVKFSKHQCVMCNSATCIYRNLRSRNIH